MRTDPVKLGIIAGGGDLPRRICVACKLQNRQYHVIVLDGQGDGNLLEDHPGAAIRLGAVGKIATALKDAGAVEVVMAGKVSRPSMAQMRPDTEAVKFFAGVGKSAFGDDALLSAVIGYIERKFGFSVVSIADILGDTGLMPGNAGSIEPDDVANADIRRGMEILSALGPHDVGQAVVVQQGLVLGVEAIEGTDALIERCGDLRREGPGGVLVKLAKSGQDERVDLPTIGVATVEAASTAGLRGVAIEAGKTIVVDRDATIAAADRLGLFIEVVTVDSGTDI